MTWVIAPASDRATVRRVLSRIDAMLGYPRDHDESEVVRGSRTRPRVVRTLTQTPVVVHAADAGVTALRGAIAIYIDPVVDMLRERSVEVDGVRKRIREWIVDQGWQVRADLPGVIERWSLVEPRDGAQGSLDGRPIPEGEE